MDEVDILILLLLTILAVLLLGILYLRSKFMAAIDNLNNNIAKLNADIDAFIASHGSNNEAQIQAAADAVAAADAKVVAATPQS